MKFSVLMSLYFKENPNFFNKCFLSIWDDQTIKPNEIVLVLDGPVGKELQECVDIWQNKIGQILKIVSLEQNLGLGQALNQGLKHCSNEWIFRMDTDDICTPDRFEKQIKFINNNPDVVLFGGQVLEFKNEPNDSQTLKTVPISNDGIRQFAQKRCPFNHMTVAYKKSVIMGVGGYQHHLFMEDYNLWLRIISAGYIVSNLPDIVLFARVGNGMHARRRGLEYINSERLLLNLKKELKLQNSIHANIVFSMRAASRLMPSSLLGKVYNMFLRDKVKK